LGRHACGWVFNRDIEFDHDAIANWLNAAHAEAGDRVKGVLRTHRGWWVFNAVGPEATWHEVEPSSDSRIECISAEGPLDWVRIEKQLLACICV
jgi:hypothetical protein